MINTSQKELRQWLLLAAFSLVLVPLGVYFGGLLLAGPYEGEAGYLGMAGRIYLDALTGKPSALLLLLAPVMLMAIWRLAGAAYRLVLERQGAEPQGQ